MAGRSGGNLAGGGAIGTKTRAATEAALAAVFREEAGRLVGAMVRILGNFDIAEEVVQESLLGALEKWPAQGVPDNPAAWLMTAARRRAIDLLRRDKRYTEKLALMERGTMPLEPAEADDRLRLIFTCCHPALAPEAQVALTLRAVAGFTTQQIAAAFLVSEPTMAQRIVRAKRKIVEANIPYRVPQGEELMARVDAVLAVLYLMFNEGYLSLGPAEAARRDMAEDAVWLAGMMASLLPEQPEVLGLLALMKLHTARSQARFDAEAEMVLLPEQDRLLWNRAVIDEGVELLHHAAALHSTGPYQLQAAIAAVHAESASWEETDWPQILVLYDALLELTDTPVVRLNRAVALSRVRGPQAALGEVNDLALALNGYHLFHATRAELLHEMGEKSLAREALLRALELCQNPAERSLLEKKLTA